MKIKDYRIDFFTGRVGADGKAGKVSAIFDQLVDQGSAPVPYFDGHDFEIRDLVRMSNRASFKGVFAKFRKEDLPHAGEPGGPEREIDLDDQEGLLEKNFFLYHRKHELLVYQSNRQGSHPNRLASYLGGVINEHVLFDPVLQPEPMRRLLRGDVLPRSLDLRIARPANPQIVPADEWNQAVMKVLSGAGGMSLHIRIRGDGRSQKESEHHLATRVKRAVSELMDVADVTRAKLEVDEADAPEHTIDLIADRLSSRQQVQMNGRYPVSDSIYDALRKARSEVSDQLQEIFGEQDRDAR